MYNPLMTWYDLDGGDGVKKATSKATGKVIMDFEVMRGPIMTVWSTIAGDFMELGRVSNLAAVEATIDADRLTFYAHGEKGKTAALAAEAELDRAIKAYGYTPVLKALSRRIRLVD